MIFEIDGIPIYFPYDYIYPEQYQYMCDLLKIIRNQGHGVLEMPSGTGKTITLLSLITSYQLANPNAGKLIYCTRTVPEMEKVLEELKGLLQYRKSVLGNENGGKMVAIGLSARKNLCIHPKAMAETDGNKIDSICRSLTASWVREEAKIVQDDSTTDEVDAISKKIELCDFFEEFEKSGVQSILPNGVYTLRDLKKFGQKLGWCPYFLARRAIEYANIVVYSYSYLLDPKIAGIISKNLSSDCIIVFDEAHNIDNGSLRNLKTLSQGIENMKQVNAQRLQDEYNRLVNGLAAEGIGRTDQHMANPVLPKDILNEAVPGSIRKGEHFLLLLRKLIDYLREKMQVDHVVNENPNTFLQGLEQKKFISSRVLRFCSDRLVSLLNTLEIQNVYEFLPLRVITDFASLCGTYQDGFTLIVEPHDERTPNIKDPVLQFCCLDSSIAIRPVFEKFHTVAITSGTLSPLDMYPRLLNFTPKLAKSFPMTLVRDCICPLVMSRGSDQVAVSTTFKERESPPVMRNYGALLLELAQSIPDGIICFFPSYQYMEYIVSAWNEVGILTNITKYKLVFIETPNTAECAIALENYRKACDSGRGAIFMSIARGKVAEGIDFDGHYGRCVVLYGVPFMNTKSQILQARLHYIQTKFRIRDSEFLTFDALRHASQCIGRVIRNKADYGIMILADKRYNRVDKRKKLPGWIARHLTEDRLNLSTDSVVSTCQKFLVDMGQQEEEEAANLLGKTLLSAEHIKTLQSTALQQQQQASQIQPSQQRQT